MDKWLDKFAESGFRRSADVAHDLKTPLNVAVLNLELLRMRIAKKNDGEIDEKTAGYLRGVEVELRRMARIFDSFFVNSVPPRDNPAPAEVDFVSLLRSELTTRGVPAADLVAEAKVNGHEARLRQAARMIAESLPKIFKDGRVVLNETTSPGTYELTMEGAPELEESAVGKLFKFYYTDPSGVPDLAMATARLILETYGGTLELREKTESLALELTLAVGDQ